MEVGTQPVRWGIISTASINERVLPELEDSAQVELSGGRQPIPARGR